MRPFWKTCARFGLALQSWWGRQLSAVGDPLADYGRKLEADAQARLNELEQAD
jgi:hypothetical protein